VSLTVELSIDGTIQVVTDHGLVIKLPAGEPGYAQLLKMLKIQQEPKTLSRYNQNWSYVMAEWERIGGCGEGKRRKPALKGSADPLSKATYTKYDAKGKVISHMDELDPI
jgi:hypothetical protein